MDQINTNPTPTPVPAQAVNQAPLLLRVLTLLGLIGAVFQLLGELLGFGAGFFLGSSLLFVLSILALINTILSIIVLVGLRRMKRWALTWLMVTTGLSVILFVVGSHSTTMIATIVLELAFLGYIWSLRSRMN